MYIPHFQYLRLNKLFISKDLKLYLAKSILAGNTGSFRKVISWIERYDQLIEITKKGILLELNREFSQYYLTLEATCDNEETFMIKCFGVDDNPKDVKVNLCNLARIIKERDLNNDYQLLVSVVSMVNTKTFYKDIYLKLIQKRKKNA